MQIVNTGNTYQIYDDSLKTYDKLPAQVYSVGCSQTTGFFLTKFDDIVIKEKIYGVHTEKVEKVLNNFTLFERNLGVILSGNKGIGKSLFAKMLGIEAVKRGYPLIIVNSFIPGIADYLTTIQQEVVILFDEFDKTFTHGRADNDMSDPQSSMLTLFDGLSQGKKMFVITCNELSKLNDYLVNRPGRFHYHFRFDYPTGDEIKEYMLDKVPNLSNDEVNKIIDFSKKVNLNFDSLRAIAFELSTGLKFEDAVQDLNIVRVNSYQTYIAILTFADGGQIRREIRADIFSDEYVSYEFRDETRRDIEITFNPYGCRYDYIKGGFIVDKEAIKEIDWETDYYLDIAKTDAQREEVKARENRVISHIVLRNKPQENLHYAL